MKNTKNNASFKTTHKPVSKNYKQFEYGTRQSVSVGSKSDMHLFSQKMNAFGDTSCENGKHISSNDTDHTIYNVINISDTSWPDLPKPKSHKQNSCKAFPKQNKETQFGYKDISTFEHTENETEKMNTSQGETLAIPLPVGLLEMNKLSISKTNEIDHYYSYKYKENDLDDSGHCGNATDTLEQEIPSKSSTSLKNSSRSLHQVPSNEKLEAHTVADNSASELPEPQETETNKKRIRQRSKVWKEEKKRIQEEEIRRKLVAPKGERIRLVDQKMLDTLLNKVSLPDSCNAAPTMSEAEFPTVEESQKQRLKSAKAPNQEIRTQENGSTARSKKWKDPIHIDLLNLIRRQPSQHKRGEGDAGNKVQNVVRYSGNQLDSSKPERKRGKMKDRPKKKRVTVLKSAILEERTIRCRLKSPQEQEDGVCSDASDNPNDSERIQIAVQHVPEEKTSQLHSRRFREYCDNFVTAELNETVRLLLKDIVKFQDRQYQRDPVKAFAKRRYVSGLREVKKYLQLKKLKFVIIAPNLEVAKTKGGIDETVAELKAAAVSQGITCLFALSRRELGYLTFKKVGISCIGICNYEGSEHNFEQMMERLVEARISYQTETADKSENVTDQVIASLLSKLAEADESPFLSAIEQKIASEQNDDYTELCKL